MNIAIVYISPNGTTKITAELLKKCLERNNSVKLYNLAATSYRENPEDFLREIRTMDIVGFGSPVYHMDLLSPVNDFLHFMAVNEKNTYVFKTFLFITYAGITTEMSFKKFFFHTRRMNLTITGAIKIKAPHFHHKDTFPTEETR